MIHSLCNETDKHSFEGRHQTRFKKPWCELTFYERAAILEDRKQQQNSTEYRIFVEAQQSLRKEEGRKKKRFDRLRRYLIEKRVENKIETL